MPLAMRPLREQMAHCRRTPVLALGTHPVAACCGSHSEQVSVGEGVTRRDGQPISPYENMRNNLKLLRKQRGLTQLQLQLATGIEQSLISKFESGQRIPPTDTLLVLADFYGVSIDYILMRTDNPKINK